ncbi:hypothetical protein GQ55_5G523700 [Panicum hallii var. hallii]|uniref:Uncharacterized protein n=2 Tax=Panicum hallii TaxID=206008 RepID=A0A2T7DSR0_9POAL|nr:hypothetical protein GQ55_5G523700 [Panicum hallii var. hallii]PVH39492.1 hypothetical protein PAHAL_5G518200 [Panicum hallii]
MRWARRGGVAVPVGVAGLGWDRLGLVSDLRYGDAVSVSCSAAGRAGRQWLRAKPRRFGALKIKRRGSPDRPPPSPPRHQAAERTSCSGSACLLRYPVPLVMEPVGRRLRGSAWRCCLRRRFGMEALPAPAARDRLIRCVVPRSGVDGGWLAADSRLLSATDSFEHACRADESSGHSWQVL